MSQPDWAAWQAELITRITAPGRDVDGWPAAALDVYRNNARVGLMDTLALVYPVCRMVVGDEFFDGLAREYARRTPSASGNLHRYGEGFADFVAAFPPCAELPYLADVARLEWAVHRGYYAADHAPATTADLAAHPAEHWGALRFALAPSCALLGSPWPLATLWLQHQGGPEQVNVDLSAGGELVLAWRDAGHMRVEALDGGEHALLQALAAGLPLGDAVDAALTANPRLDLQALLARGFARGLLILEN